MKPYLFFCSFIMLIFTACRKDEINSPSPQPPNPTTPVLLIDSMLLPFVQKFVAEGEKRGVTINTQGFEAHLVDEFSRAEARNQGFCGYGWWVYPGKGTPRVEIKVSNENCWNTMTDLQKENLMFHEFGHALLSRNHTEQRLYNGSGPKSIMCTATCSNFGVFYRDGPLREYYFDELFNNRTPTPDFIKKENFVKTVFEEDFETGIANWEVINISRNENSMAYTVYLDSLLAQEKPKTLAIRTDEGQPQDTEVLVLQRFELTDFKAESNLKAKANIRTKGLTDGRFEMNLSIRERDANGELHRIFVDTQTKNVTASTPTYFEDYELEVFCIPDESAVITVSFGFYSATAASIFIDEVRVELYE